jgi:hypothetical protein
MLKNVVPLLGLFIAFVAFPSYAEPRAGSLAQQRSQDAELREFTDPLFGAVRAAGSCEDSCYEQKDWCNALCTAERLGARQACRQNCEYEFCVCYFNGCRGCPISLCCEI